MLGVRSRRRLRRRKNGFLDCSGGVDGDAMAEDDSAGFSEVDSAIDVSFLSLFDGFETLSRLGTGFVFGWGGFGGAERGGEGRR